MASAETILDRILDLVKTSLAAISIANGDQTDVSGVYEAETIAGYNRTPQDDFEVELFQGDEVRNVEFSAQGNPPLVAWDVPIQMSLIHRPSEDSTVAIRRVMNRFWADVIKALFADPQWSGLAINTEIGDPENGWNDTDGYVAKIAAVTITYRHYENNPYSSPTVGVGFDDGFSGGFG
jgi:hypothetical protein